MITMQLGTHGYTMLFSVQEKLFPLQLAVLKVQSVQKKESVLIEDPAVFRIDWERKQMLV